MKIIITAFRIHVLRWKMAADSTVLEMFDGELGRNLKHLLFV